MNAESVYIELNSENELYVFFGGISGGLYLPKFEFCKTSRFLNASRVLIRDMSQAWYHNGLQDSGNIEDFITDIKNICSLKDFERITFVGNSMGGYAALLTQLVLDVGRAVAFNPQTFISHSLRLKYNDLRWNVQIDKVKDIIESSPYNDLYNIAKNSNSVNCEIHVAKDDELDLIHARHLSDFVGVKVFEHESGGHNLVGALRNTDQLLKIVQG